MTRRRAVPTVALALCGLLATATATGTTPAAASTALEAGAATPSTSADTGAARPRSGAVQRSLDSLVAVDAFPGALAAVRGPNGRIRNYTAGVGDLESGRKVPLDGAVRIGSDTKPFTAVVLLQLVGEGKVDLDGPVEDHLPGLVRGDGIDGRDITVRQLLQHTSGVPEYVEDVLAGFDADPRRYFEPRQLLDAALARPADSSPGTTWQYSNTNYVLAGLIVQAVTGRPVGEEITRRVIEPLGLRETYWPAQGELGIRGEHPRGYYTPGPGGELVDITEFDPSVAWAAGQMVASPSDLLRFYTALVGGELLSAELLREMQTTVPAPASSARGDEAYGLGLQTFTLSCGGLGWTHGGDIYGFETRGAVTTDGRGAVVAVTSRPTTLEAVQHVENAVDGAVCG